MSYKVVKQESLVEEKLSVILKLLFAGKKQMTWERTENKGSQGYSNFRTSHAPPPPPPPPNKRGGRGKIIFNPPPPPPPPPKKKWCFLLVYLCKFSGNDSEFSFRFAIALETLWMVQWMQKIQRDQIDGQWPAPKFTPDKCCIKSQSNKTCSHVVSCSPLLV